MLKFISKIKIFLNSIREYSHDLIFKAEVPVAIH